MCLLTTVFAALISSILWYKNAEKDTYKLNVLMLIYWGASLMWSVDAVFEYMELGTEFFNQPAEDLLNDAILGLCVTAFGLAVWFIYLLIKDPKNILKKKLMK